MKLQDIYTKLTVKDKQYKDTMKSAKQQGQDLSQSLQNVSRVARRMFVVLGGAMTGLIALAGRQEAAEVLVDSALRSAGESAEKYGKQLKDAAAAMQKITTYGDEAIMPVMALALNMGISGERTEEATKQAIGLAKALKMDLSMAMRAVALAHKGEFTLLRRYIPALRVATTEQEKWAAFLHITAAGWQQEQDAAKTGIGQLKQLKNLLGDVGEAIGAAYVPSLKELVGWVKRSAPAWGRFIKDNEGVIRGVGMFALKATALLATLGPLLVIIGKFKGITGLMTTSIWAAKRATVAWAAAVGFLSYELAKAIGKATGFHKWLSQVFVADAPQMMASALDPGLLAKMEERRQEIARGRARAGAGFAKEDEAERRLRNLMQGGDDIMVAARNAEARKRQEEEAEMIRAQYKAGEAIARMQKESAEKAAEARAEIEWNSSVRSAELAEESAQDEVGRLSQLLAKAQEKAQRGAPAVTGIAQAAQKIQLALIGAAVNEPVKVAKQQLEQAKELVRVQRDVLTALQEQQPIPAVGI